MASGVERDRATDPFAILGLTPAADAEAVRAARRRLAMEEHPDRGGDAGRMRAINVAFEEAMARLTTGSGGAAPIDQTPAARPEAEGEEPPEWEPDSRGRRASGRRRVERDEPSFVIEALPADAFEALLIVANWMGDVIVDDPPYVLEVHLHDPAECWCRLELLPEAGASTIMLVVAGVEGVAPPIEAVRDRWVANLNQLGRPPE